MRLARVAPGSSAQPILALERDGALYDVAELERIFDTRFSPERMPQSSDFHMRAIALGCDGLDALDDRLRAGDRPTAARLLPGDYVWLPPCDTERAHYVQLAPYEDRSEEPVHRLGDARALLGHDSVVPFPPGLGHPVFELGLGAVLGESLAGASEAEAEHAILGFAILNAWSASDAPVGTPWQSRPVPAQLGPVLVTAADLDDVLRLRAEVRVGGAALASTDLAGAAHPLAASIAWVSRWVDLRAGDVVGAGLVRRGRGEVAFGTTVELVVERLGKLAGRPLRRAA